MKFKLLLLLAVMAFLLPHTALAADSDSDGYDDHDFTLMQTFLNQPSAVAGNTNGKRINSAYNPANASTWTGVVWSTDSPKRIAQVGLNYTWYNKSMAGTLDISDMTGLTELDCGANKITAINTSGATALKVLTCYTNQLTTLDVSTNTALETLMCVRNPFTTLNLAGAAALSSLSCAVTPLTTLDISANTALTNLECSNTGLTTLDVSANTALTSLICSGTGLTTLDVSHNLALTSLNTGSSPITALDLRANTALITLHSNYGQLNSLNVTGLTALKDLYCVDNQLTTLDVSTNTGLTGLFIWDNQLTQLDVSHNTALQKLYCERNQLTGTLDLSHNSAMLYLFCNDNQLSAMDLTPCKNLSIIQCMNNRLTTLDAAHITNILQFDCRGNPLTQIDATIDNNNVSLTARGLGYVELSYQMLTASPFFARAIAHSGTQFAGWWAAGTSVSTAATYTLTEGSAYDLDANFTYTVTLDENGGDTPISPASIAVISGKTIYPQPQPPTRYGFTFTGWYREAACQTPWHLNSVTIENDLTLYAGWEVARYTVSFAANSGSTLPSVVALHNTLIAAPAAPTREGYAFNGWYRDAAHQTRWDFNQHTVLQNTTLYADWTLENILNLPEESSIPNGRSITFNPLPAGGDWTWDETFLTADTTAGAPTFSALKQGQTTLTYTVDGVSQQVLVTINEMDSLPVTGETGFPAAPLLGLITLAAAAAILLTGKRLNRR